VIKYKKYIRGVKMDKISEIYEKAGLFYLGKDVDKKSFEPSDILTLIKNKNFTTHAAIIGMTGSGKTGLGIGLLEEAAIDNIPSIIIDPKGDMGNMLLTDPTFSAQNFKPWVEDEAKAKGVDPLELAKKTAQFWKEGIKSWHQDENRVAKFHNVKKTIYTPGSNAGVPINILSSLECPNSAILEDTDNFSSYLSSTVSSLLALIGLQANELDSKEFILLSQIIAKAWQNKQDLTIQLLVGSILQPSFKKIGVLPLESFYPKEERFKLANKFNAVIASPSFLGWLEGESLNIEKLLYDSNGNAKVSIFSISHLSDAQRMFFVTLLLNKIVAWMRMQSGASRLRALLYMDEIYGYFPPTKNPPSKEPMITLLKQARAFGLGVVLSTQNPVDIDYKGLSNIGTWFIGRLQTTQDINRVIEGLGGKIDSSFSKDEIKNLLSNLEKRVFFLKSAHLQDIRLFSTRWVLSYLKGPLKKSEISLLMKDQKQNLTPKEQTLSSVSKEDDNYVSNVIIQNVIQRFEPNITGSNRYYPTIAAVVEVGYSDSKRAIDLVKELSLSLDVSRLNSCDWDECEELEDNLTNFPTKAPSQAEFKTLPQFIAQDSGLKKCQRELKEHIYATSKLELFRCKKLRLESNINQTYEEFVIKVKDILQEKLENELEELKEKFEKKEQRLQEQIKKAQLAIEKEKADQTSSLISAGISILSAFFGRSSATKIGTAVSRSSRVLKERGDISRAEAKLEDLLDKLDKLENDLEEKIEELNEKYDIKNYEIETIFIKPKKSLIDINEISILWRVEF
jgi:hypothetical protein